MNKIWLFALILIIVCTSCLEELDSSVGTHEKILVVDGLVTNGHGPFEVRLSYTTPNIGQLPDEAPTASISIEDDLGNEVSLNQIETGLFETPASFYAEINRSYKLIILTGSTLQKRYESNFCLLRNPSCIDSISIANSEIINSTTNERSQGFSILVDGSVCEGEDVYLRWGIREDWKFGLPYPETLEMIEEDEFKNIKGDRYCFQSTEPKIIQIHSFNNQISNKVVGKKIFTIPTTTSYRFRYRYKAKVKQYSISQEEYNFWNKLKETSQNSGDIFGKQPFTLQGNIKCITDPKEKVLGYFQVAGISTKSIYVNRDDIYKLNLSVAQFQKCEFDTIFKADVYSLFNAYKEKAKLQSFFQPHYDEMGTTLLGLVFTQYHCSDCQSNAAKNYPPDDWVD